MKLYQQYRKNKLRAWGGDLEQDAGDPLQYLNRARAGIDLRPGTMATRAPSATIGGARIDPDVVSTGENPLTRPEPKPRVSSAGASMLLGIGANALENSGQWSKNFTTGRTKTGVNVASSALKGASFGNSLVPGLGALVGGVVGAGAGLLSSRSQKRKALNSINESATEQDLLNKRLTGARVANDPELLTGYRGSSMYAHGGLLDSYEKGGWIKKAVNPAHKGYCTPMTKSTCTPRRKAFARTMKKHHGFHKKGDGGEIGPGDELKPVITHDRMDPRIKNYQDSLRNYGFTQRKINEAIAGGAGPTGLPIDPTKKSYASKREVLEDFYQGYRAQGRNVTRQEVIDEENRADDVSGQVRNRAVGFHVFPYKGAPGRQGTFRGKHLIADYKRPVQPVVYAPKLQPAVYKPKPKPAYIPPQKIKATPQLLSTEVNPMQGAGITGYNNPLPTAPRGDYRVEYRDEQGQPTHRYFQNEQEGSKFQQMVEGERTGYWDKKQDGGEMGPGPKIRLPKPGKIRDMPVKQAGMMSVREHPGILTDWLRARRERRQDERAERQSAEEMEEYNLPGGQRFHDDLDFWQYGEGKGGKERLHSFDPPGGYGPGAPNPYMPETTYAANGGKLLNAYAAKNPDTEFSAPLTRMLMNGGKAKSLSSDNAEFTGSTHSQGGIDVPQMEAELEAGETTAGNYVFSKRLGFADLHRPIARAKGIIERKPPTGERLATIKRLARREGELAQQQEFLKSRLNLA